MNFRLLVTVGTCVIGFSAMLSTKPVMAQSVGPNPLSVILVSDKILALDHDDHIWQRDAKDGAAWGRVTLADIPTNATPWQMGCSRAEAGLCIFSFRISGKTSRVLYKPSTGKSWPVSLSDDANYLTFLDSHTLLYTRKVVDSPLRELHAFDVDKSNDLMVDRLAPGETFVRLNVDGESQPFLQQKVGDGPRVVRPLGKHPNKSLATFDWADGFQFTDYGILRTEWPGMESPVISGRRSATLLSFASNQTGIDTSLRPNLSVVLSAKVDAPQMPSFFSTAVDANNDFMAELIGREGRSVAIVCSVNAQTRIMKPVLPLRAGEIAGVTGWPSANGFLVTVHSLSHSDAYKLVQLSSVEGGLTKRACATTQATITDIGIPVTTNTGQIDVSTTSFQSSDGTVVPVWIAAPHGITPKHLIIDVYGAFGELRAMPFITADMAQRLAKTKTVLAFPIVRGDGDNGFAYAVASRAPSREKAVQDVVSVATGLTKQYPDLIGKPTLRGGSAGAWLAFRTTLEHPELFSGAIGFSGGYLLIHQISGNYRFFEPSDSLSNTLRTIKPGCGGAAFRFLHAQDDMLTPYDEAADFSGMLKAKGCTVNFLTFEQGGHQLHITDRQDPDYVRLNDALFTAF